MYLLADNEAINAWLAEHPIVLGLGAVLISLMLLALGIDALRSGRAPTKRGPDLEGANAKAMGFVWLGFGSLCLLFGVYKIVSGLL